MVSWAFIYGSSPVAHGISCQRRPALVEVTLQFHLRCWKQRQRLQTEGFTSTKITLYVPNKSRYIFQHKKIQLYGERKLTFLSNLFEYLVTFRNTMWKFEERKFDKDATIVKLNRSYNRELPWNIFIFSKLPCSKTLSLLRSNVIQCQYGLHLYEFCSNFGKNIAQYLIFNTITLNFYLLKLQSAFSKAPSLLYELSFKQNPKYRKRY